MNKTIAITGATGFVGSRLVQAFAGSGYHVVALCRKPDSQAPRPGVTFKHFDLHDCSNVQTEGADILIHCAIEPYRNAQSASKLNVAGGKALFDAARSKGVRKIVFLSSTASREQTASQYGRDKFAVEGLLDTQHDLVVRAGLVAGNGGLFRTMYGAVRKTRFAPLFFGGCKPVYIIGIEDLASAVAALVNLDRSGVYMLSAPPISMRSFYLQIARKANVRVRLLQLPFTPVLRLLEFTERLGINLPLTSGSMKGVASMEYVEVPSYPELGVTIRPLDVLLDDLDFTAP